MTLPEKPTAVGPDGSDVRVLLSVEGGSMAHFEFPAGETAPAVRHRSVDEVWYVLSGSGQMWLSGDARDEVIELQPTTCVAIPAGTAFQVRVGRGKPLAAIGTTMPPWPGEGEAAIVLGKWAPTLEPGPH